MPHSPQRRRYLTNWAKQHRERLRALPLRALKKLTPTVYTIAEIHRRARMQEVACGKRLPSARAAA
jgi:hypothetical protein